MSRGMQTDLTSGAYHGRTQRLYVWGLPRGKRKRRNGLALCGLQSPAASAQARPAVGGALRGHDAPVAAGRQKDRWPPWLGLGCHVVCALGGVDAGEKPQRTRHGVVSSRECRGAGVHWATGRPQAADSGPFQHCAGLYRSGQGGGGRDQRVDSACGQGRWLCRCQYPVGGYHSAGVAHWVSQRTRDLAGFGTALWPSPVEAQNAWRAGSRRRTRSGPDDPQIGQRTPPVCQGHTGKAAGVDAPAHRGGPVGGADAAHDPAARREPRACDARRPPHAEDDARGGQAPHPTDRAMDHHRSGSQGQNCACWCDAGTCNRPQQGGEEGRVWPIVSLESPRWGVCLWNLDSRGGGRVEDALAGAGGIPGNLWGTGHPRVGGLRPGRLCRGDRKGAGPRGSQGDWHSAQRRRDVACGRGRPRDGPERARQDGRDHWHPEDGQIWVQQAQGTSVADAGDGRAPVYPLLQSEQVYAGPGTSRQMRRKGMGTSRTAKIAPRERQERRQEAPHCLQRSFATRSIYQATQHQKYEEGVKSGTRTRKPGGGSKGKLPTMADKLLFVLYYYKTYPTFDVLGTQFELVRSKAHENLHKLSPILYDTLVH